MQTFKVKIDGEVTVVNTAKYDMDPVDIQDIIDGQLEPTRLYINTQIIKFDGHIKTVQVDDVPVPEETTKEVTVGIHNDKPDHQFPGSMATGDGYRMALMRGMGEIVLLLKRGRKVTLVPEAVDSPGD